MMKDEINSCPICGEEKIEIKGSNNKDLFDVSCPRCDKYSITQECFLDQTTKEIIKQNSWALSGLLAHMDRKYEDPVITTYNISDLLKDKRIPEKYDIESKANYLLKSIKSKTQYFGELVEIKNPQSLSICFAENIQEFNSLAKLLRDWGLVDLHTDLGGSCVFSLTANAFTLLKQEEQQNQVFIANWFTEEQTDTINTIEKAVRESGYEPMCIRNKQYKEIILAKALSEIRKSNFIIVNLTGMRNAVIYEAGFAEGLGLEAIFIRDKKEKDKKNEFYTGHHKINYYENLEELKEILPIIIQARFPSKN